MNCHNQIKAKHNLDAHCSKAQMRYNGCWSSTMETVTSFSKDTLIACNKAGQEGYWEYGYEEYVHSQMTRPNKKWKQKKLKKVSFQMTVIVITTVILHRNLETYIVIVTVTAAALFLD